MERTASRDNARLRVVRLDWQEVPAEVRAVMEMEGMSPSGRRREPLSQAGLEETVRLVRQSREREQRRLGPGSRAAAAERECFLLPAGVLPSLHRGE